MLPSGPAHDETPAIALDATTSWASTADGMSASFCSTEQFYPNGPPENPGILFTSLLGSLTFSSFLPFASLPPGALSARTDNSGFFALQPDLSPGEMTLTRFHGKTDVVTRTFPATGTDAHHLALRNTDAVLVVWQDGGALHTSVQAF